jgi:diguanylate cyclase (GGDEF)-like protein
MDVIQSVLSTSLQNVSIAVIILNGNKLSYFNQAAQKMFTEFIGFENDPVNFILSHNYSICNDSEYEFDNSRQCIDDRKNSLYSGSILTDVHLLDVYEHDRFLSVEIVEVEHFRVLLVTDTTKQRNIGWKDPLTGLGNRAMFDEKIYELERLDVYPLSVIMGDVNGLKLTNDVFGYDVGDLLLKEIANAIRSSVRERTGDIVCRWGGDEYALLLPFSDISVAKLVISRIKNYCSLSKLRPITPAISLGCANRISVSQSISEVVRHANENMASIKLTESSKDRLTILQVLRNDLETFSKETLSHSIRLGDIMVSFGSHLGLSETQLDMLLRLATYHDIGIAALPKSLLSNGYPYSSKQRIEMQHHVLAGYKAMKAVPEFIDLAIPVLHHHENWDGSGYVSGIGGRDIDYLARITRICDSYEIMTSPLRVDNRLSHDKALSEISNGSGKYYDPDLSAVFVTLPVTWRVY